MTRKQVFILTNILGSSIFLFFPIISSPDFSLGFDFIKIAPFQRDFISYLLLLGFFYLNYYLLVPNYYLQKKFIIFTLALIGVYLILLFLPELIVREQFHPRKPEDFPNNFRLGPDGPPPMESFPRIIGHYLIHFLIIGLFSLFLRIYSQWRQMEEEKTNLELRYLRAQINPHFLFNTLNVIYAHSIEENANKTAASLIQLSDLLRHVLNESHKEQIPLSKEIEYIRAYISLQSERTTSSTALTVNLPTEVGSFSIPPLLLIPFIENAFKYGTNPEENSSILIDLKLENNHLVLLVKNDIVSEQMGLTEKSGIGIQNTKDRLNHLFGGRHQLTIEQKEGVFSIELKLQLHV